MAGHHCVLSTQNGNCSVGINIDAARMELRLDDGTLIAIDTIVVENEVADNMYQRSELDWLIYNKPLEYVNLILNGGIEDYIKGTPEQRLMD